MWNELGRQVGLSNILRIMRRKGIATQTKRTCPQFGAKIHLAIGVQKSTTATTDGVVGQSVCRSTLRWKFFQRSIECSKRRHTAGCFQSTAGPAVKGQARPRHFFRGGDIKGFHDFQGFSKSDSFLALFVLFQQDSNQISKQ